MTTNKQGVAWRMLSALAVLALLVAACGGEEGGGDGDGSDTTADASGTTSASGEGEGGGLLAELQEAGSITVGVANEIPYGYEDESTGEVTGEAPEVARLVFAELGVENMEAQVVEFGALIAGLQAGNFDMIAAGMYITPERAEEVLFSDPDYCVLESMLVPEGNPDGLTNYNSVADTDVRLAVASGTVNVEYAVDAGIPEDQIVEFAGIEDQYDAIAAGRVEAVSGTILTVQQHADVMEGFEALPSFPALDAEGNEILGCGGFGFRHEDADLRDAFNEQLNAFQETGEVQAIVEEFFEVPLGEDAVDLTVADLTGN